MQPAFVLGNGKSRKNLDLLLVREYGPIYGCNALYREFTPDCLVATDAPIASEIQHSGYSSTNRFHTRRPIPELGAKSLPKEYKGYSSGPNAVAQACIDGYKSIYLIGFDLGTTDGQFNNLYANTQFYKKITDPPTFSGNWIKQLRQIASDYPDTNFTRVQGIDSTFVSSFAELNNFRSMPYEEFEKRLNNRKGML